MPLPRPVGRVQNPSRIFAILERLGVNRPQTAFELDGDVVPTIIIDSGVDFTAAPTPPYRVVDIFSAGIQTAPAAGSVLADTGPLSIGSYSLEMVSYITETSELDFEWRNAANSANLAAIAFNSLVLDTRYWTSRFQIQNDNERLRVVNPNAGTAGKTYEVTLQVRI